MSMPGRTSLSTKPNPRTERISWDESERARLVARGREIVREGATRNLTSVMQKAQLILPNNRRRSIQTAYAPAFRWFAGPLQEEMERMKRGDNGPSSGPVGAEVDDEPDADGSAATAEAGEALDETRQEGTGVTMEQLMEVDPRMLLRALERHCLTRLDAFAGMLLDMESMFARMSAMRSLGPLATGRIEPRSARDTPNLRRLVHAPRPVEEAGVEA